MFTFHTQTKFKQKPNMEEEKSVFWNELLFKNWAMIIYFQHDDG